MKKYCVSFILATILCACSSDDEKAAPTLEVSVKQIEAPGEGIVSNIAVTSNGAWTATSAAADWCKVIPASGKDAGSLEVTVLANPSLTDRTTSISVKSEAIEKKIEVVQEAAGLKSVLTGTWEMTAQNSGDPNYNDLVGLKMELKADGKAIAHLGIEIPDVGLIEKLEGTWKVEDQVITISAEMMGMPISLTLKIDEMTEDLISSHMNFSMPGLFPQSGIPVLFEKK